MSLAKIKKFTDNRLTMNDAMDELLSKLDVAIDDMEQGYNGSVVKTKI